MSTYLVQYFKTFVTKSD